MKRKYEETDGGLPGEAANAKATRKPRKSSGIRVSVSSIVQGGNLIPVVTTPQGVVRKDAGGQHCYTGQALHTNYSMMGAVGGGFPQQVQQYHRQPMTTWNPPVYTSQPHGEAGLQWTASTPSQFKQEPAEQQEPLAYHPQHNTENVMPTQQQQQQQQPEEFQHLFSPLKYLNELDCDQQYHGLGVAPLPLHGQVRPVKVEAGEEWAGQGGGEPAGDSLTSTPPILRRPKLGRTKQDREDERLDQVRPRIVF